MKRYSWQPESAALPTSPGVYRFVKKTVDDFEILYVGKAKNLKSRLSSYFQDPNSMDPRIVSMLNSSDKVDWTVVNSETEALQLEHTFISKYKPKYNIRFRDDKSYPYISLSLSDEAPRLFSTRRKSNNSARYFGPFPNPGEARHAVDSLIRVFPVRTCSKSVFQSHQLQKKACLLGHINKCHAPCLSESRTSEHREIANKLEQFLDGAHYEVLDSIKLKMKNASNSENFEDAAKYRDQILAIDSILQKSAVSTERDLSADFIGIVTSEMNAMISTIRLRNGRVVSEERYQADLYQGEDISSVISDFLLNNFNYDKSVKDIFVTGIEIDTKPIQDALGHIYSSKIQLHTPKRGEKLRIAQLALKNAEVALAMQHKSILADLNSRSKAMQDLAEALDLPKQPLRIECIDVSHLQGTDRVAAVVIFEDGLPARSEYRSYVLNEPGDDLAGIREVVTRRIHRYQKSDSKYTLGLLVIDGGPWQADAANQILQQNGIKIPVVGLAKRLEEVWLPAGTNPIVLPRNSLALFLLQQIRDETHRRAISHHRNRRSRRAIASVLDDIEGVGPAKRSMLLKSFGGAGGIRNASVEEISQLPGISLQIAENIFAKLHAPTKNLPELPTGGQ